MLTDRTRTVNPHQPRRTPRTARRTLAAGLASAALSAGQLTVMFAAAGPAGAASTSSPVITFAATSVSAFTARASYTVNRAPKQIAGVVCSLTPKGGAASNASCGAVTASTATSTSYAVTLSGLNAASYTYQATVKLTDGGKGTNSTGFTVKPVAALCTVTPYAAAYTANPHTATGSCTGVGGVDLSADLNLSGTTHTNAGAYSADPWTFTDPARNYTNPGGTIGDTISQAKATCTVASYSSDYDASPHTATGSCTGVGGVDLSADLNLAGTTHTNAGSYSADPWTFTDPSGNYTNQGGTVGDTIAQATANCTVTPYRVTYDANPHTATGTCTGVGGVDLSADLNLTGTTHTAAGAYPADPWSFTDPSGNYTPGGGTVGDAIDQAITFTSTPPAHAVIGGGTYTPTATSSSGSPTLSIDNPNTAPCAMAADGSVTFTAAGTCTIDANQAGANQVQQSFTISVPLAPIPQIQVNYPNDPQVPVIPPNPGIANCPPQDSENGGCAINPLDGTITNVFDARSSIDPNLDPSRDTVTYHWQIFWPFGSFGDATYNAAGISGYRSPVLTIAMDSLPDLSTSGSDIYWRAGLTVTVNGQVSQTVYFRFIYASDIPIELSTSCLITGYDLGGGLCSETAPQLLPATEPT